MPICRARGTPAPDPYLAVKPAEFINAMNTGWVLLGGGFWCSACRPASRCWKLVFVAAAKPSTCWSSACSTHALCGLLHWGLGLRVHVRRRKRMDRLARSDGSDEELYLHEGRQRSFAVWRYGHPRLRALPFPVRVRRLRLDDLLGRDGGDEHCSWETCCIRSASRFHLPDLRSLGWGPDGFLATMGSEGHFLPGIGINFHDFAGSTVVHSIGGWVAIAGAICLGPRLGRKFKRRWRRPDASARSHAGPSSVA